LLIRMFLSQRERKRVGGIASRISDIYRTYRTWVGLMLSEKAIQEF